MPSVRSLILLSVLILVVSLLGAWLSLYRTPDSGCRGTDSYGTRGYGYRALFELLNELDVPVRRQITPPDPGPAETSLVLLQPNAGLTSTEPTYLRRLLPWVENGGRLTIALPRVDSLAEIMQQASAQTEKGRSVPLPSVLETLGLPGVKPEIISTLPDDQNSRRRIRRRLDEESFKDEMIRVFGSATPPARLVDVESEGTLQEASVARLALPGDEIQVVTCDATQPSGMIRYVSGDDEERILAVEFPRGQGRIIVVSDDALFRNRYLAQADNSVLAARVISPQGQAVVFDEFYHGLGVRGNPLFLMTRPGYAALALGLLLFSCLIVWREAVLLGPSLPDETVERRDIGEYLSAMGRLFSKGRAARPFLVEQMRAGLLREWCRKLSIATETPEVEFIAGIVSRRNPGAGERLRKTVADIDDQLKSRTRWTEHQTIDAMRRLTACLSTNT